MVKEDAWYDFNLLKFIETCVVSILENIPCALEKHVYSAALGWNTLKMSIKSIWSSVSFKAAVSSLIFYLEGLSIEVNGVLKPLTMSVFLSISHVMSIKSCFIYLGAPVLDV